MYFPIGFVFFSLKIVFVLVNSADPNELSYSATIHLGFHCLPKNPLTGIKFKQVPSI